MISHENLTIFQSALFLTNAIVVEGSEFVLVVDPTWLPQEVEEIAQYVASIRAGRPLYVLFTHSDFDHILGAGAFPEATTIASQAFIDNPNKERKVQQILEWDSEYYIRRPYELRYPDIGIAIVDDGQTLTLGETTLTFYHAPGHNPDGLFTVIEPHGILIAGDYLSDIEFPYIYQSSTAYEATLGKLDLILEKHRINVLVPGHGQAATAQTEMRLRQRQSFEHIQTLRGHIAAGNQPALDAMLDDYAFPLGMKSFHDANQKLVREEGFRASWDFVERFFEELVTLSHWSDPEPMLRLVKTIRASERAKRFRAGQSLTSLCISTTPYHGLKPDDPFVSAKVHTINLQKKKATSFQVLYFDKSRYPVHQWICAESELLPCLDKALSLLWADTREMDGG